MYESKQLDDWQYKHCELDLDKTVDNDDYVEKKKKI